MYYFHLYDQEKIMDSDGTDLIDVGAAREHAAGVARELTANTAGFLDEQWSGWTMMVHDERGMGLFSLAMSDFKSGTFGKSETIGFRPVTAGVFSRLRHKARRKKGLSGDAAPVTSH